MTSSDDVPWLLSATLLSSYFEGKMLCWLQKLHDPLKAGMKTAVFTQPCVTSTSKSITELI